MTKVLTTKKSLKEPGKYIVERFAFISFTLTTPNPSLTESLSLSAKTLQRTRPQTTFNNFLWNRKI